MAGFTNFRIFARRHSQALRSAATALRSSSAPLPGLKSVATCYRPLVLESRCSRHIYLEVRVAARAYTFHKKLLQYDLPILDFVGTQFLKFHAPASLHRNVHGQRQREGVAGYQWCRCADSITSAIDSNL